MLKIIKSPIFQIVIVMIAMALFDPGKAGYKIKEFSLLKTSGFLALSLLLLWLLLSYLLNFQKVSDLKHIQTKDKVFIYLMIVSFSLVTLFMGLLLVSEFSLLNRV